jgi:hypothetical protein
MSRPTAASYNQGLSRQLCVAASAANLQQTLSFWLKSIIIPALPSQGPSNLMFRDYAM